MGSVHQQGTVGAGPVGALLSLVVLEPLCQVTLEEELTKTTQPVMAMV